MTAKVLDGKEIAQQIMEELKPRIASLLEKGVFPGLSVIILGQNPASMSYVKSKGKACERLGMRSETIMLAETVTQKDLMTIIAKLNTDPKVHGILVQLPLPKHIDEDTVLEAINPEKDVDGFSPINMGRLLAGRDCFKPCTPNGIMELMARYGIDPAGKHAVIIGRSNIVGKPMAMLLMQKHKGANATVTVCHSRTKNMPSITKKADILIAAIGSPEFVKADMVKKNAVVIDVGINRVEDATAEKGYRLVGDVDYEAVKEVASAITPVPGGVGRMTIAMLMLNAVQAAENFAGQHNAA
ncbi:MAG: bifunctional methylenetetrahydrofolate dehydrogenase/methenyltetrahydrofolate cyclohydrolase FolD [Candidatus Thermoplasmatota archaeon]|nr:bifunctional methylenetetrahydrofolate dehydrogenase/methenyltetrahydrofolate cyclohydrolase FolD [Euryarchaeota archaeon]MBU4031577.1 bifunctional methylenetetrahydrofolate dehydrogenase/methenyltetrahydrofolate cyclohydrolase FolD [Candidatus Thermoplasmatota archaeon]MBU4070757.1 bifunctional methylenetetrahydrofolate dehydrogenase/methenyltetrahydrofolate cyclohydrolase FolD [Candidatus Thermoplasmatota archaeon]MBU4144759.1 bifunctional methylenetetrahydrofolate dehydrogenase/methenyltet